MDNKELLEELSKSIDSCVMCGGCHADCPTYFLSRKEDDSARGKVVLADAVLKGELEVDGDIEKRFDNCLACMKCVEVCPAGANPVKVITAVRAKIRSDRGDTLSNFIFSKILTSRANLSIFGKIVALAVRFYKTLPALPPLPFVKDGKKRILPDFKFSGFGKKNNGELPAYGRPSMRVAYFRGCMVESAYHDTGMAVIDVLRSAGADVVLFDNEVCCSAPAYYSGDIKNSIVMAEKNLELFNRENFDFLVTSCATCGSMLKEVYPMLLGKEGQFLKEKVFDFQELIVEKLFKNASFKSNAPTLKVTYHDPCHLSRGMKVRKAPRDILKALPGIEFIEMDSADNCCGGGGAFAFKNFDDSMEIGRLKAESIKKSGADIVATACPSCVMQLEELTNRFCPGVEVADTASIIRKAIIRTR